MTVKELISYLNDQPKNNHVFISLKNELSDDIKIRSNNKVTVIGEIFEYSFEV